MVKPRRQRRAVLFLALCIPAITGCGRLSELQYEPAITPTQWCEQQPCFTVGNATLTQPLGSALVFLLAALWIAAGIYFLGTQRGQRSRTWFGISLVLGGLGAAAAGISFQTFGYELKCVGRDQCLFTNGFEVGYSISQAVSVSVMLIAISYACTRSPTRTWLVSYAIINAVAYLVVATFGVALPSKPLLSFELLMLFALPGLVAVFLLAMIRYRETRDPMYKAILWAAILLVVVQIAYFGYYAAGITAILWDSGQGFYFSENDVLHVGMILWLIYAVFVVGRYLRDLDTPATALPGKQMRAPVAAEEDH